jgi:hypothetical protein
MLKVSGILYKQFPIRQRRQKYFHQLHIPYLLRQSFVVVLELDLHIHQKQNHQN